MRTGYRAIVCLLLALLCGVLCFTGCGGGSTKGSVASMSDAVTQTPAPLQQRTPDRIESITWNGMSIETDGLSGGPAPLPWAGAGEEDAFGNMMHTTWARIDSVQNSSPITNQPAQVIARFTLMDDDQEEDAVTQTATIIYRVNGGPVQKSAMAQTGTNTFQGEIPAQASGAVVDYFIRIQDDIGNVTTGAFPSASSKAFFVSGVSDVDNSEDIVPDDMDLFQMYAGYDDEYVYVGYSVLGEISGGTMEPPYMHGYGIKFTNPDIEQSEGLMVGKLWVNAPIIREPEGQENLVSLLAQVGSLPDSMDQNDVDEAMESGQIVMDIGKWISGNILDGLLFNADPESMDSDGLFIGRVRRESLGQAPSGYFRMITLTAANASLDSFMPIPLNCSHYITLKTGFNSYTVP